MNMHGVPTAALYSNTQPQLRSVGDFDVKWEALERILQDFANAVAIYRGLLG